jgi:hypothetical protein
LLRKAKLDGPFIEVKSEKWVVISADDSDDEILPIEPQLSYVISKTYEKSVNKQKNVAKAV